MSAPIVNSVSFDSPSYSVGAKITCTVDYTPGAEPVTNTLTGVLTSASGVQCPISGSFVVMEPDATTAASALWDGTTRVWTVASNAAGVLVLTATA